MTDETVRMALARCQQVDGLIGLKIDLATQPMTDVEDIVTSVLGQRPTKADIKTLIWHLCVIDPNLSNTRSLLGLLPRA